MARREVFIGLVISKVRSHRMCVKTKSAGFTRVGVGIKRLHRMLQSETEEVNLGLIIEQQNEAIQRKDREIQCLQTKIDKLKKEIAEKVAEKVAAKALEAGK